MNRSFLLLFVTVFSNYAAEIAHKDEESTYVRSALQEIKRLREDKQFAQDMCYGALCATGHALMVDDSLLSVAVPIVVGVSACSIAYKKYREIGQKEIDFKREYTDSALLYPEKSLVDKMLIKGTALSLGMGCGAIIKLVATRYIAIACLMG